MRARARTARARAPSRRVLGSAIGAPASPAAGTRPPCAGHEPRAVRAGVRVRLRACSGLAAARGGGGLFPAARAGPVLRSAACEPPSARRARPERRRLPRKSARSEAASTRTPDSLSPRRSRRGSPGLAGGAGPSFPPNTLSAAGTESLGVNNKRRENRMRPHRPGRWLQRSGPTEGPAPAGGAAGWTVGRRMSAAGGGRSGKFRLSQSVSGRNKITVVCSLREGESETGPSVFSAVSVLVELSVGKTPQGSASFLSFLF
ncbi:uncharacterized protein LOC116596864 [Mustela erminea]|uniref:uncharacterized protein LOC116596864 n=1 Tax=Mustela erminea TaxID=36723 RepID=UPI001386D8B2|nr:uncharacterized protein LOC116596864 [Mustela erminea]